ncbi:MAG: hypothetical protein IT193_00235 [Propionibacteriaceae bacterium]|nr:hypothetical protein [Propionibacteriaceae bacterium]
MSTTGEAGTAAGEFCDIDGERSYRIDAVDLLPPFFMTLATATEVWCFLASTGGLTAGRWNADHSLLPYYTDDKITENAGNTGGVTLIRDTARSHANVWEPFSLTCAPATGLRSLAKTVLGDSIQFTEEAPDRGLRFSVTWTASQRYGLIRRCRLTNTSNTGQSLEVLDGLRNLLPAGVTAQVQSGLSNLVDAYKRGETDPETGMAIFTMSSLLTDLAEPAESLSATVAWQVGLPDTTTLLSTTQVEDFRAGGQVYPEAEVRGQRSAYLNHSRVELSPGATCEWVVAADVELDAAQVVALKDALLDPGVLTEALDDDLAEGRRRLRSIVASVDGFQVGGDERTTAHHTASSLFNAMRGGVPVGGYRVDAVDFRAFIGERNRAILDRCAGALAALPPVLEVSALRAWADTTDDPDLARLAREYLPLTFSRRHGDPSRPWNRFEIRLQDSAGVPTVGYQGNWRDIFQNWEALAWSHPEYLENMICIFANATTADGYNPYRVARSGIEWEVPEPENPWANLGYWSDHQIIYLQKLLEASRRFSPGAVEALLERRIFTHADVPYRMKAFTDILADPANTIDFDVSAHRDSMRRQRDLGGDGALRATPNGDLERVTLAEKLLLLLAAKLVNLVPDGGIWMNTQRPEWNDANNALVGRGLSVVTLGYLRRYLVHLQTMLTGPAEVNVELSELIHSLIRILGAHRGGFDAGLSAEALHETLVDLGRAGEAYRQHVYSAAPLGRVSIPAADISELLELARHYVEVSLARNVRSDGMVHSYNTLELSDGRARIGRLALMLEGQVSMLSSGVLDGSASLRLLAALRDSSLFRADQHSYLLYPDKDLAGFLARNVIGTAAVAACPFYALAARHGDRSVTVTDSRGLVHFAPGIRNASYLREALDKLADDPRFADAVSRDRELVLDHYEATFNHRDFTGRSGSFFAFEGLGSIYWHMVSKLLLAVQETIDAARFNDEPDALVATLAQRFEDIREGLGYRKSPDRYGAFPIDPYSHTPAHAGARQPGMTGQVKEDVLIRIGELGVTVSGGRIQLQPERVRDEDWTTAATSWDFFDPGGRARTIDLPSDSLAFSFCQTPISYRRSPLGTTSIEVVFSDGTGRRFPGTVVPEELSREIFARSNLVESIVVHTPVVANGGRTRVQAD